MAPHEEARPATSPGATQSKELSDLEKAAAMLASQGHREYAASAAGSCKYTQASYPSTPLNAGNESRATVVGPRYSARDVLSWASGLVEAQSQRVGRRG